MSPFIDPLNLIPGALAFIRISAILFALPFFGDAPIPIRVRVLLAVALTFMLFPQFQGVWTIKNIDNIYSLTLIASKELILGISIGILSRVSFDGVIMAANVVANQMGFGADKLFVPDFGTEIDSFTAFHRGLIILIFLALNLHYIFIIAIRNSFKAIPLGNATYNGALTQLFMEVTSQVFSISLQLAAPILVALLFATAALGIISRAVPQINSFALSFPINLLVGMLVYMASLQMFPDWVSTHFETVKRYIDSLFTILSHK